LTETPLNGHSKKVKPVILALQGKKLFAFEDKVYETKNSDIDSINSVETA